MPRGPEREREGPSSSDRRRVMEENTNSRPRGKPAEPCCDADGILDGEEDWIVHDRREERKTEVAA